MKLMQVYGRMVYYVRRYLIRLHPDLSTAPKISKQCGDWVKPACRQPSMSGFNCFFFLNKSGKLEEVGWEGSNKEKLWRYNQHYFDDLNARNADHRSMWHYELIKRWINDNPPGEGLGWDPYPLSLRIINWIKWSLGKGNLDAEAIQSMAIQLRWLSKNLEVRLLGNHLFINAKALVFGGLFFEGVEANSWFKSGVKILQKEVKEQILDDGGHFELSTMYHVLVLEDILDIINILRFYSYKLNNEHKDLINRFEFYAQKMYLWYLSMCHPDGHISFFNDAAFDIAPRKKYIDAYVTKILNKNLIISEKKVIHNKESGYIRVTNSSVTVLIDVAEIGADYLPGHGHADVLSFELSFGKYRTIVNSGTLCYGNSRERLYQRGTSAHNTVTINGEDSSEIWGDFRCARSAKPQNLEIYNSEDIDLVTIKCAHDGYKRLKGKPQHIRTWYINKDYIKIEDKIEGDFDTAIIRIHFHPSVQLFINEDLSTGNINLPNKISINWYLEKGKATLEDTEWYPRFGETVYSKRLVFFMLESKSVFCMKWN